MTDNNEKPIGDPIKKCPVQNVWIEVGLHWKGGGAIGSESYILTDTDGIKYSGTLDNEGIARIESITKGTYSIEFPDIIFEEKMTPSECVESNTNEMVYSLGRGPTNCESELYHKFLLPDWELEDAFEDENE